MARVSLSAKRAKEPLTLTPFEEVISAFKAGKMVIIADDADRENEGDLVIATEKVTGEALNFMMNEARGLICVSLSKELGIRLDLPPQVSDNQSPFSTPFTVSVDHRNVASEGVTANARAFTMRMLVAPESTASDFVSPGHVFPLIANDAGVLGRQGQTEGSLDLARISGCIPSGVLCEILMPDGTMARGNDLLNFSQGYSIPITSVAAIIDYRIHREIFVREVSHAKLNTSFGEFETKVFIDDADQKEHLVVLIGDPFSVKSPLVRIHSECLTGDVFGSLRCDCGEQLNRSLDLMRREGSGIVLYLRQEGRGIGLLDKLRAYALQDQGHDTVDANIRLGFEADQRDFAVASHILQSLGIRSLKLVTNNPRKLEALNSHGITVTERIPIVCEPTEYSKAYLETKRTKLGHLL